MEGQTEIYCLEFYILLIECSYWLQLLFGRDVRGPLDIYKTTMGKSTIISCYN